MSHNDAKLTALVLISITSILASFSANALVELRDVASTATGGYHACALTRAGGVKCWGNNDFGQLGDSSTVQRLAAVDVTGIASGAVAIAAGEMHTCALGTDGRVKCWGRNDLGQLGDSSTAGRVTPVAVAGLPNGIVAITSGLSHTCALTSGGAVKCWGYNNRGQLGDGSFATRTAPVDVSGLTGGVASIAAGAYHTCAVTSGGAAKCWGYNSNGQLGNNSGANTSTPLDVAGLASGVTLIAGGAFHTCALVSGGAVKCWGSNSAGQVGDNSATQRAIPVAVSSLASGVTAISAGWNHTCVVVAAVGVKCWGTNLEGALGDNSTVDFRRIPVDVVGLGGAVGSISAGGFHTCAVMTAGGVACWGLNYFGELGDGSSVARTAPVDVSGLESGMVSMAAGDDHTCALTSVGGVKCWGRNSNGQVGDGSSAGRLTAVNVATLASGVVAIVSGESHTCALTAVGGVKCWGLNNKGQLGINSTLSQSRPIDVPGLASGVAAIAAARWSTCAVTTSGALKCWGHNGYGQLGGGSGSDRLIPTDVPGLATGVIAAALGSEHACALTASGGVKCWGGSGVGQIGDGANSARSAPVDVSNLQGGAIAIASGGYHTCALTLAGAIRCWGYNGNGQLGDNTDTNSNVPVEVRGLADGAIAIAAGLERTCAITSAGGAKCWGFGGVIGALGDGSTTIYRDTPVDVAGLGSGVTALAVGSYHTCAIAGGGAKCWGDNSFGQVGDGTAFTRNHAGAPVVSVASTPVSNFANYTDLWWNAAESGWGINLNHQGDVIFATLYTYDETGQSMWLAMVNGERQPDGSFLGSLYRSSGAAFDAVSWTPGNAASVGMMRITFSSMSTATLAYSMNGSAVTKPISRFVFSATTTCNWTDTDRSTATNYQDLWWNPSESGWGLNIAHQGSVVFATLYTYSRDGSALWLAMPNGILTGARTYSGELYGASGPRFDANPWGSYQPSPVGAMTLSFTDGNNGTLTYLVNGSTVVKTIRRFVFANPKPQCGP
jgi:alpha-tubulin suppressor-like RCC1 family protein